MELGEKMQNKGYYGIQGHSRSSRSVPIESPYATSY